MSLEEDATSAGKDTGTLTADRDARLATATELDRPIRLVTFVRVSAIAGQESWVDTVIRVPHIIMGSLRKGAKVIMSLGLFVF